MCMNPRVYRLLAWLPCYACDGCDCDICKPLGTEMQTVAHLTWFSHRGYPRYFFLNRPRVGIYIDHIYIYIYVDCSLSDVLNNNYYCCYQLSCNIVCMHCAVTSCSTYDCIQCTLPICLLCTYLILYGHSVSISGIFFYMWNASCGPYNHWNTVHMLAVITVHVRSGLY